MKRYPFKSRHTVYNEASFYTFSPLVRKPVVPGEKISQLQVAARLLSAVFEKANVTPMLAQMWAFYIPNRLVWDQWVDFVALDPAVPTAPTSTATFVQLYDVGVAPWLVFPRRALKLTYNSYFGQESEAVGNNAWYTNILDDTDVSLKRLLAWDQYRAATTNTTGYTPATYVAPVSGASATITLDDLVRSLELSRAKRRQKASGDKYVDTMRLFGVELDWRVQQAPEFLGTVSQVLTPREKSSSQAVDAAGANQLYKRASEYQGNLTLNLKKPVAFAEHGYVLVCMGFRPVHLAPTTKPADAYFDVPADFYRPELTSVFETADAGRIKERYYAYIKGSNQVGLNANGNIFTAAAGGWYPPASDFPVMTGSGPSQMAVGAEVQISGLSPVVPNVA